MPRKAVKVDKGSGAGQAADRQRQYKPRKAVKIDKGSGAGQAAEQQGRIAVKLQRKCARAYARAVRSRGQSPHNRLRPPGAPYPNFLIDTRRRGRRIGKKTTRRHATLSDWRRKNVENPLLLSAKKPCVTGFRGRPSPARFQGQYGWLAARRPAWHSLSGR